MSSEEEGSRQLGGQVIVTPEIIQDVCEWLDLKMGTGRYTFGLAFELAYHMAERFYHVHLIYDEIGILEGTDPRSSRTKDAAPFEKPPLLGLWHKHHFQPYFIGKNLRNELRYSFKKSIEKHIGSKVEDFAGILSYDLSIGAYRDRSDRMKLTGEWIVFEKDINYEKYYLSLGEHRDRKDDILLRKKVTRYKIIDIMIFMNIDIASK